MQRRNFIKISTLTGGGIIAGLPLVSSPIQANPFFWGVLKRLAVAVASEIIVSTIAGFIKDEFIDSNSSQQQLHNYNNRYHNNQDYYNNRQVDILSYNGGKNFAYPVAQYTLQDTLEGIKVPFFSNRYEKISVSAELRLPELLGITKVAEVLSNEIQNRSIINDLILPTIIDDREWRKEGSIEAGTCTYYTKVGAIGVIYSQVTSNKVKGRVDFAPRDYNPNNSNPSNRPFSINFTA